LPWLKKWRADVILGKPLFRSAADTDGILGDAIPMPSDARQARRNSSAKRRRVGFLEVD